MDSTTGLPSVAASIRISPKRSSACRPFTTVGVGKGCVPTSSIDLKKAWPMLMKRALAESHLAPFIAYATSNSGAVDHWKKLAKKAELELLLERDTHRADNSKYNITIHRINRRLIPLEKALGKTKEALKQQEKVINYLRSQLLGLNERNSSELAFLRNLAETLQKKLVGVTQTSKQKIQQLQVQLRQSDSRTGNLQARMNEIYQNVDGSIEIEDSSGNKDGSPESGKTSRSSDELEKGLIVISKIHRMKLSKLHFVSVDIF